MPNFAGVFVLALISCFWGLASLSVCPRACSCGKQEVYCSALMSFPVDLPVTTERLKFSQLNVEEIPRFAFQKLPHLKSVHIVSTNIAFLRNCAFEDLNSLSQIIITKSTIGFIDGNTFRNVHSLSELRIEQSMIGEIRPFAFNNIYNVSLFRFSNTTVTEMFTSSFYKISNISVFEWKFNNITTYHPNVMVKVAQIQKFHFVQNVFDTFQCQTLEDLSGGSTLVFEENQFLCKCSLTWLITKRGDPFYNQILDTNKCSGPGTLAKLDNLRVVSAASLDCQGPDADETFGCPHNQTVNVGPNDRCMLYLTVAPDYELDPYTTPNPRSIGQNVIVHVGLMIGCIVMLLQQSCLTY